VLAHSLSVINVQSAVALHVMDDAPEQVRPALEVIKATSKETLEEVRATLATLRGRETQTAQPVGKIADTTALDSMAAAAGLQATVSATGVKTSLPVAVDVAAYRIAQEAITNVAKHSAAKEVEVDIDYGDAELRLTITDPGPTHHAALPAIGGHGLQGMKERAADLGGDIDAGRLGSGFRVKARLPFAPASGAEV
jgi:signal transduction histidine kinase